MPCLLLVYCWFKVLGALDVMTAGQSVVHLTNSVISQQLLYILQTRTTILLPVHELDVRWIWIIGDILVELLINHTSGSRSNVFQNTLQIIFCNILHT